MEGKKNITRRNFVTLTAVAGGMLSTTFIFAKKLFARENLKRVRTEGVYTQDKRMPLRKSQDNPEVKLIYKNFLEHANSHKAHELLHTEYFDRSAKIKALREKGLKLTY